MFIRIALLALLVFNSGAVSAATREQIQKVMSTLSVPDGKRTVRVRELTLSPDLGNKRVIISYGLLVDPSEAKNFNEGLKKKGLMPWPLKPVFAIRITVPECTHYMIDIDLSGKVRRFGTLCSQFGELAGLDTEKHQLFRSSFSAQVIFDVIIEKALKE